MGLTAYNQQIDYIHWDDLNEIVDHLWLLEILLQAGYNGGDNEILSIIEELFSETGLIINLVLYTSFSRYRNAHQQVWITA